MQTAMNEVMELRQLLRRKNNQNNRLKAMENRTDFSATRKMQKPPLIMPNYGKQKVIPGVPKTKVSRVLLYDNVTQQHMLDVKVAHIKIEKERMERIFDLHMRSFSSRMAMRSRRASSAAVILNNRTETREIGQTMDQTLNRDDTYIAALQQKPRNCSLEQATVTRLSLKSDDISDRLGNAMPASKLKLPEIDKTGKDILFNLKTKSGRRKTYYSSDEGGLFLNLFPLHKFYPDVTADPRFTNLESLLIAST